MYGPAYTNPNLDRTAIVEAIAECRKQLAVLEARLGTPNELPGDVDRASEVVHRINNLTAAMAAFDL